MGYCSRETSLLSIPPIFQKAVPQIPQVSELDISLMHLHRILYVLLLSEMWLMIDLQVSFTKLWPWLVRDLFIFQLQFLAHYLMIFNKCFMNEWTMINSFLGSSPLSWGQDFMCMRKNHKQPFYMHKHTSSGCISQLSVTVTKYLR